MCLLPPCPSSASPFDDDDWLFELKLGGFRALAQIDGHHCRLVSRTGHTFKQWPYLEVEVAHAVRCQSATLDGEICCLDDDGRSNFHNLLFRCEWPFFCAFDLLNVDGRDLCALPLIERKMRLKAIMPKAESRGRPFVGLCEALPHAIRTGSPQPV